MLPVAGYYQMRLLEIVSATLTLKKMMISSFVKSAICLPNAALASTTVGILVSGIPIIGFSK